MWRWWMVLGVLVACLGLMGLTGCVRPPPPAVGTVLERVHHGPDKAVYIVGHTRVEYYVRGPGGFEKRTKGIQWLARCLEISTGIIGGKLNCKRMDVLGLPTEEIERILMETYEKGSTRKGQLDDEPTDEALEDEDGNYGYE